MAVVVAKEPMPSVSKKLVTAPTASWPASGNRPSVAGESAALELARAARIAFVQPVRYTAVNTPSAVSSPVMGFMPGTSSMVRVSAKRILPGRAEATGALILGTRTQRICGSQGTRITRIIQQTPSAGIR